jgi:transcriptional regulator with XRE-family HTH domain
MTNKLAKELTKIRGLRGISLRQAEKETGISNAYLSQLENGKAENPSPHILLQLAEFYEVPYESLMESAGHLQPTDANKQARRNVSGVQAALMSTPLDEDEQEKVAEFVEFLRTQRQRKEKETTSRIVVPVVSLALRPESEVEVSKVADRLLRRAGVLGKLPTPIDDLIKCAGVGDVGNAEDFKDRFLFSLPEKVRDVFQSAWQKIRGIADMRERVVYVPADKSVPRMMFAKAHELGHQVLPWHQVKNVAFRDDELSLSSDARDLFDVESNYFAAEVIFQGKRFLNRIRDYAPSFDAVFSLADEHGASKHATLRRYVEEHDELIAAVPYWPSSYAVDEKGHPVLRIGKLVGAPSFIQKYADIQLPRELRSGDPWAEARDQDERCQGDIKLDCGSGPVKFQWQSWWNKYSLLVLLRRKPALGIVGGLVR